MLEKLDTLIAFAVVMLGVSLMITILTQIVSSALGLRGSNLLWGIETLLKELAPSLVNQAHGLATELLQHELISDSAFSRVGNMRFIGPLVQYLSTKKWSGWFINRWRCATAIRSEELVRMLQKKIASLPDGDAMKTALIGLLAAPDLEAIRMLKMMKDALPNITPRGAAALPAGPNYSVQVDKIFQQVTNSSQRSVGKLETWFGSSMDRVTQRFAMHLRLWTVAFAFLLAFAAHFYSWRLLQQLSYNPDTRAALVNMRDGMQSAAQTILPPAGGAPPTTAVPVSPDILNEALVRLKKSDPALANVGTIPANTVTVQDAVTWLTAQKDVPPAAAGEYQKTVIGVLRDRAASINQNLASAGVQLLPNPYPGILNFDGRRNLLGILLAAAFLSLGAPFWFNALKNLSNLRSVVATKEQQESSAS